MSKKVIKSMISLLISFSILALMTIIPSYAIDNAVIAGTIYGFNDSLKYDIGASQFRTDISAGLLVVKGNIQAVDDDEIPQYIIKDGVLSFYYTPNNTYKTSEDDKWHFVDDNSKDVNGVLLSDDIKMGAILVQSSFDHNNWVTISNKTNVFADSNMLADSFYEANEIQLINGCYYRILVVYKTTKKSDEKDWLGNYKDLYKYYTEFYELYAGYPKPDNNISGKKYSLGTKINAGKDTGYSESNDIKVDDPHYGWDIGNFFISGYTEMNSDSEGVPTFLKNIKDKVVLSFNLSQDIDALNGRDDLKVSSDSNGHDQYFEIDKTDFGHGALIIRYTDYEGIKHKPEIYTNYLEALSSPGADTIVRLFEEGDYEVALDYELCKSAFPISDYPNYQISFRFKIRNGNCMVYPFDIDNNSELFDGAVTQNGFFIDLAKSRYLRINVIHDVWSKNSAGQYEADTRFNRPAKDGDTYTDEGIYTITATNPSDPNATPTIKRIYVGNDSIMIAYMNPDNSALSVNDIVTMVADGARIEADGTIYKPVIATTAETTISVAESTTEASTESTTTIDIETTATATSESGSSKQEDANLANNFGTSNVLIIILIVVIIAATCAIITVILLKKGKQPKPDSDDKNEVE